MTGRQEIVIEQATKDSKSVDDFVRDFEMACTPPDYHSDPVDDKKKALAVALRANAGRVYEVK